MLTALVLSVRMCFWPLAPLQFYLPASTIHTASLPPPVTALDLANPLVCVLDLSLLFQSTHVTTNDSPLHMIFRQEFHLRPCRFRVGTHTIPHPLAQNLAHPFAKEVSV